MNYKENRPEKNEESVMSIMKDINAVLRETDEHLDNLRGFIYGGQPVQDACEPCPPSETIIDILRSQRDKVESMLKTVIKIENGLYGA